MRSNEQVQEKYVGQEGDMDLFENPSSVSNRGIWNGSCGQKSVRVRIFSRGKVLIQQVTQHN